LNPNNVKNWPAPDRKGEESSILSSRIIPLLLALTRTTTVENIAEAVDNIAGLIEDTVEPF
jgi:hypothetical protein